MKNNNTIITIVLGITTLFLGISCIAWTIIPRYQVRQAYIAFQKAKAGDVQMVTTIVSIFEPYTYAQPQIRNELLDFIFAAYKDNSPVVMNVLPFAIEKMKEVVDRDNGHPKYLLTMAKAYNLHADITDSSAQYNLSNTYYQKALALVPHNPDIIYAWGISLIDQGKTNEGLGLLKDLLAANSNIAESHYYLGLAYFKINRYNDALTMFEQSLAVNPLLDTTTTVDIYVKLFEHYYRTKDVPRFVVVSTRLSSLDAKQGNIYKNILDYIAKRNTLPPINIEKI